MEPIAGGIRGREREKERNRRRKRDGERGRQRGRWKGRWKGRWTYFKELVHMIVGDGKSGRCNQAGRLETQSRTDSCLEQS